MLIVAFAFIIGFLYLLYIWRKDHYEKEPFGKLTATFLVGGTLSVVICLLIYRFIPSGHTFTDAILKIGPIEELSKLLALWIVYQFYKKEFNEPADGLVYMSAVALGFSTIENIFYAFSSDSPYILLGFRSIICVLGHMAFSGYMGIAFYIHKKTGKNWSGLLVSFSVASLAHGLYDGFLFDGELGLLAIVLWIMLIIFLFAFFNMTLSLSPFKKKFVHEEFEEIGKTASFRCIQCEALVESNRLRFVDVEFSVCESCDYVLVSREHVYKLFTYYRPGFRIRRFKRALPRDGSKVSFENNIHYHGKFELLSASHSELEKWLMQFGRKGVLQRIETRLSGKIFSWIGADKLLES